MLVTVVSREDADGDDLVSEAIRKHERTVCQWGTKRGMQKNVVGPVVDTCRNAVLNCCETKGLFHECCN